MTDAVERDVVERLQADARMIEEWADQDERPTLTGFGLNLLHTSVTKAIAEIVHLRELLALAAPSEKDAELIADLRLQADNVEKVFGGFKAVEATTMRQAADRLATLTGPGEMVRLDDVLRLLDDSVEGRWSPSGGDPKYIDGYETGVADACLWIAEDLRRGPPYPFKPAMQSSSPPPKEAKHEG